MAFLNALFAKDKPLRAVSHSIFFAATKCTPQSQCQTHKNPNMISAIITNTISCQSNHILTKSHYDDFVLLSIAIESQSTTHVQVEKKLSSTEIFY